MERERSGCEGMGRVYELTADVKSISRGKGRSATAAAAYRACIAIECEREGKLHDYSRKGGLEASGIVVPEGSPAWAKDRAKLWNGAELRERNKDPRAKTKDKADAVVAREFMFGFPVELSEAGRLAVAERIARHLVEAHGVAADYSIHRPGRDGDQRNFHCHLLTTTRRMTAKGLGEKAREWDSLHGGARLTKKVRAFIAKTLNDELEIEGKAEAVHVEHRSYADRAGGGPSIKPQQHMGPNRTHAIRTRQGKAREAWFKAARIEQEASHAKERRALKVRQDFALAAIQGDFSERERRGVEAIRADLAAQQAADRVPTGVVRFFQIVSGGAMKADFERQARQAARVEAADHQIAALRAGLRAEHAAYATCQLAETRALAAQHGAADRHLMGALSARVAFDRAAEVELRREPANEYVRERPRERDFGLGMSP